MEAVRTLVRQSLAAQIPATYRQCVMLNRQVIISANKINLKQLLMIKIVKKNV